MPTREEFKLILERNQPTLFRGAAKSWRIRERWTRDIFLRRYGSREATTTYIPYGQLFDVTNDTVKETLTVSEYVDGWGTPEEQQDTPGVPRYFFSVEFAEKNPDLLEVCLDCRKSLICLHFRCIYSRTKVQICSIN